MHAAEQLGCVESFLEVLAPAPVKRPADFTGITRQPDTFHVQRADRVVMIDDPPPVAAIAGAKLKLVFQLLRRITQRKIDVFQAESLCELLSDVQINDFLLV